MESGVNEKTKNAATGVRRSVTRLARRLRLERVRHGVSASRLIVLGHLLRNGVTTAKELAALENVQPQSLTRILLDLEKARLIHRTQAEVDRRQVHIEITQNGRELLVRDAERQDEWLGQAMATVLTEAERDLLDIAARLLNRLSDQPATRKDDGLPEDSEGGNTIGAADETVS
jgi:DNA-binding MarR family transcriptional regulator